MNAGGMDDKRVNVLYADTLFLFFEGNESFFIVEAFIVIFACLSVAFSVSILALFSLFPFFPHKIFRRIVYCVNSVLSVILHSNAFFLPFC